MNMNNNIFDRRLKAILAGAALCRKGRRAVAVKASLKHHDGPLFGHLTVAYKRQRTSEGDNGVTVPLHDFGKLADMVEFAADFNVAVVDIAAHPVKHLPIKPSDPHLVAVCDPELFLIVRGDEADAFFSVFHVAVKPVPAIAADG